MGRHARNATDHERAWNWVHPTIRKAFASFYWYVDTSKNQNYIGAEARAFAREMLPLVDWKGPGEVVQRQLIQTAPQVYVTQSVVPTGIAGVGAGQVWNGQLVDNPNQPDNLSGTVV
jgi:hypothetical protein